MQFKKSGVYNGLTEGEGEISPQSTTGFTLFSKLYIFLQLPGVGVLYQSYMLLLLDNVCSFWVRSCGVEVIPNAAKLAISSL